MHKFHHEILPTSFKDFFRKRPRFIVIIQDKQSNKTILYKFQQALIKRQFLVEELYSGKMQNNTSKIYAIMPSTNNTEHFCYCNINELSKNLLPHTSWSIFNKNIFTSSVLLFRLRYFGMRF